MATEIKIWSVVEGKLVAVSDGALSTVHIESQLETWICDSPGLLGEDLLVIDRQRTIPGVGRLDLLCLDSTGRLVVVEVKRDSSTREAIAQSLDYASWFEGTAEQQILDWAEEKLGKPLSQAFMEHFNANLTTLVFQKPRIILVAPGLDAGAERIIRYLSTHYAVEINAVFFKYSKLPSGHEILARTVLVPENSIRAAEPPRKVTLVQLQAIAEKSKTQALVNICREMKSEWDEWPESTYEGSLRYWTSASGAWRMIFGVNVAGGRLDPPVGKLDVWVPARSMAELTGIEEAEIRRVLTARWNVASADGRDIILRLSTTQEAETLVSQLKQWVSVKLPSSPVSS